MSRKNLSNNKPAMLSLKYMKIAKLSTRKMSDELFEAHNQRWATCTISRNLNTRERAIPKPKENLPQSVFRFEHDNSTIPLPMPKESTTIIKYFKDVDPATLSFGDLCSYTASFFDDIESHRKGEKGLNPLWKKAKDKVFVWNKVRERTSVDFAQFTRSQMLAYDYCQTMHTKITTKNQDYHEVYALYREWVMEFPKSFITR